MRIKARLNRYWRIVATGYNFATFGLGGLLLTLTALPVVRLWPGTETEKNARARKVIHHSFRYFIWQMRVTGVVNVDVKNVETLKDSAGALVIANHPCLIDVVILISLLPNASCIVKQDLWKNPFLRGVVIASGYVSNTGPESLLAACNDTLNKGFCLIVFPEGTRTKRDKPLKFQRGAANIAVRCNSCIIPVTIESEPPMLRKGERWYQVPVRQGHITVSARPKLVVSEVLADISEPALATRQLNRYLEDYYKGVLNHE
jgi:1-acyl-sn-glycerol-3-phosphate acyltransferase